MNWTTALAIYGAATGSYGAVVATLGRRDVRWRRAAKQIPTTRLALEDLRNAVASVQQGSRPLHSVRATDLRANLDIVQEVRIRVSDKKLTGALVEVDHCYSALIALSDDALDHRKSSALTAAASAIDAALTRVAHIEKKAPP